MLHNPGDSPLGEVASSSSQQRGQHVLQQKKDDGVVNPDPSNKHEQEEETIECLVMMITTLSSTTTTTTPHHHDDNNNCHHGWLRRDHFIPLQYQTPAVGRYMKQPLLLGEEKTALLHTLYYPTYYTVVYNKSTASQPVATYLVVIVFALLVFLQRWWFVGPECTRQCSFIFTSTNNYNTCYTGNSCLLQ